MFFWAKMISIFQSNMYSKPPPPECPLALVLFLCGALFWGHCLGTFIGTFLEAQNFVNYYEGKYVFLQKKNPQLKILKYVYKCD